VIFAKELEPALPDGDLNLVLTFNPAVRLAPPHGIDPYGTVGFGLYYNLSLMRPTTVNTVACDPFFGLAFPQPLESTKSRHRRPRIKLAPI
jgi:hypothetical protein